MITSDEITGVDPVIARRLLIIARSIAPCINELGDSDKADVIAIIQSVAAELPGPGMSRARSQSRNGTSVTWADYRSAFTVDDRDALRALCGVASATGAPVGDFPPSTITRCIWPPEPVL